MGKRPKNSYSATSEELHVAARAGDLDTVQSICNSNPLAINSRDKLSRTPLHLAAWAGQSEVVSYLCKNKAEVGAGAIDNMGAIHLASQKGHLEIVRILLSSGVSVRASSWKGLTPLHYAIQGSHLELVKYLVKKGASLTAKTKSGKIPLDFAKSEEIRSFLVEGKESSNKEVEEKEVGGKGEELASKGPTEDENVGPEGKVAGNDVEGDERDKSENAGRDGNDDKSEGGGEEREKRDGDEIERSLMESKKARVELSHLLAGEDNAEGEEL